WSGNVLWSPDGAVLIDPAAHGGHRETDLAMLALFGCPHLDAVLAAYDEAAPLAAGWRDRVPLHQLFPLLVHVVLFGGGYAAQAAAAARAALRAAWPVPTNAPFVGTRPTSAPFVGSAPVVEQPHVLPVVAGLVGAVHRDARAVGAEARREQLPVRLVAGGVHPAREPRGARVRGEPLARRHPRVEGLRHPRPRPDGGELHVRHPAARLGAGARVTHGEAARRVRLADQHHVTEVLVEHRSDLAAHVEAGVDRVGDVGARVD